MPLFHHPLFSLATRYLLVEIKSIDNLQVGTSTSHQFSYLFYSFPSYSSFLKKDNVEGLPPFLIHDIDSPLNL